MKVEIKRDKVPISYEVWGEQKLYGSITNAGSGVSFGFFAPGRVPLEVLREIVKFADEQGLL